MPNQHARNTPQGAAQMVGDAFGTVIAESPGLKTRLHDIANALLDKVLWDIEHGDPATVAQHMKSFLPLLAREAAVNDSNERIRELENEVREMRRGFGEMFGSTRESLTPPSTQVDEDAPPA